YVLFRAERPGEYAVAGRGSVIVQPGSVYDNAISRLSSRYDLSKVFGTGTLYPGNALTGQQAVMLYAVLTKKDTQITGLTPVQKASKLGIGDIISAKQLTGYMDNQSSASMAVKLYCAKANVNPAKMKPTRSYFISNSTQINTRLYPFVVLSLDLNIAKLENRKFDALSRTTAGAMLDMVSKVLEKFEK
ncbi:MAG: hypothetical protein N2376_09890, partial [Clostridia bacterium]|nr:hypothetical protein [Clostridia bacterium]